jgi:hypothetical protein
VPDPRATCAPSGASITLNQESTVVPARDEKRFAIIATIFCALLA